jgi:hypothetical protein
MIPVEIDSEFAAGGIQNANTLWYHFLANPVAGNGRDTIALHWSQKIGRNTVGRKLIRSTPDRLEPLAIASKCFAISILRLVGKPSVKEQIKGSAQWLKSGRDEHYPRLNITTRRGYLSQASARPSL